MKDKGKTVALKAEGKTKMFTPTHAERLLALPGTVWEKVEDEKPTKAIAKTAEDK